MRSEDQSRNVAATSKRIAKSFARRFLGLEVRQARRKPKRFHYNLKYVSRFMHFGKLLKEVASVEGAIVECGVGAGRSLFDFLLISRAIGIPRPVIAYDTFAGIPDATDMDGVWNADLGGTWKYSQGEVIGNLLEAGLDLETVSGVEFVEGELKTTLPSYNSGPIALLHLDVDIYESYKTALEHLYEDVAVGGIIAFDEYRQQTWPGATRAIDEFFLGRSEQVVRSPVADRYYAIKCA